MALLQEAHEESSPGNQGSPTLSINPTIFKEGSTPPLSPRSSQLSPRSQRRFSGHSISGSPLSKSSDPIREVIPQVSHRLAIDTAIQPSWTRRSSLYGSGRVVLSLYSYFWTTGRSLNAKSITLEIFKLIYCSARKAQCRGIHTAFTYVLLPTMETSV